jgi:proline dehydrogenase
MQLQPTGITTILTRLGENISHISEADEVCDHYLRVLELVQQSGLDAQVSVKPTQLGFDQDVEACFRYLTTILDRTVAAGNFLWLDMESSAYVDGTIALYRRLRERSPSVGLALQAYLYRTEKDVEALVPIGAAIRLVKGAYLEPASVAYPKKSDVDAHYFALASRLLQDDNNKPGALVHVATHDVPLQERVLRLAAERNTPRERFEIAMLFGIQSQRQRDLAKSGVRIRCLISYGEHWFPWYMRRLGERPANIWFVVKNAFGG